MLNRTEAPTIQEINKIEFVAPDKRMITPLVPLYHMKSVANETCRIDLYFDAGKCRGTHGLSSIVNGLLLSGTSNKTSVEINNAINSKGGFYESGISMENAVVSIYCLREFASDIFDTVIDAIKNLSFRKEEVDELIADRKQKFKINLEKVSFLAQKKFQEKIFASSPNYGSSMKLEDFDKVDIDTLKSFHETHYLKGLFKVVLVGNVDDSIVENIAQKTAELAIATPMSFETNLKNEAGTFIHEKEGAIQTAIRVGRTLFNKKHDDYLDFIFLQTILGDYFGSRLMANIREDKGYTYGIGCALPEVDNTGYFLTVTEVRKDVRDATLDEIKKEFEKLQNEPVSPDELSLVKNYMLGQLLKSADGPFAMTDLFLSAEMHGLGLEMYNEAIESIQNMTSERIQQLAQKYLQWEDMSIIACG